MKEAERKPVAPVRRTVVTQLPGKNSISGNCSVCGREMSVPPSYGPGRENAHLMRTITCSPCSWNLFSKDMGEPPKMSRK